MADHERLHRHAAHGVAHEYGVTQVEALQDTRTSSARFSIEQTAGAHCGLAMASSEGDAEACLRSESNCFAHTRERRPRANTIGGPSPRKDDVEVSGVAVDLTRRRTTDQRIVGVKSSWCRNRCEDPLVGIDHAADARRTLPRSPCA
jgi:hypothetical protein